MLFLTLSTKQAFILETRHSSERANRIWPPLNPDIISVTDVKLVGALKPHYSGLVQHTQHTIFYEKLVDKLCVNSHLSNKCR